MDAFHTCCLYLIETFSPINAMNVTCNSLLKVGYKVAHVNQLLFGWGILISRYGPGCCPSNSTAMTNWIQSLSVFEDSIITQAIIFCRPLESLCLWNDLWQEKEEIRKWIFVSACVPIWQECFFFEKNKTKFLRITLHPGLSFLCSRTHTRRLLLFVRGEILLLCRISSFLSVDGIRKLAFSCQQRRCSFRES